MDVTCEITLSPAYATPEDRWDAVLKRDPLAEGYFYYAVRTTGVFCRPTCPSRRPHPEHVAFFDTADDAQRAGFRPCARCRPTDVSVQQQAIARAKQLLETNDPPSLAALGQAVGMSPSHLQRLFKQVTGLSPRQYAAAQRRQRLKTRLRRATSVTAAQYAAGYGSSRALYEAAGPALGMTPGAYRNGGAGTRIAHAVVDSPLGRLLVAATERGVCAVRFGDDAALRESLRAEYPRATLAEDPDAVAPHVRAILDTLSGQPAASRPPLDVRATAFQERVWDALQQIPRGQTRSYSDIARQIGAPTAVRAVARACASNPVALLIPCHRVVPAGGGLGGYRWGVERKQALLDQESANPTAEPARANT
jgi:AraC family transcriptional regulator, regulatory protein of adaptative response / methylated-DNA-[protein]-cysteine methyltransferase